MDYHFLHNRSLDLKLNTERLITDFNSFLTDLATEMLMCGCDQLSEALSCNETTTYGADVDLRNVDKDYLLRYIKENTPVFVDDPNAALLQQVIRKMADVLSDPKVYIHTTASYKLDPKVNKMRYHVEFCLATIIV